MQREENNIIFAWNEFGLASTYSLNYLQAQGLSPHREKTMARATTILQYTSSSYLYFFSFFPHYFLQHYNKLQK